MTTSNEQQIQLEITETSDFYNACAANDIPRIISHLANMSPNEINRIEPNGDTALHVACYHHNAGAVYLLLKFGALDFIKNRRGLTPFEDTTSLCIKEPSRSIGQAFCIDFTFSDPPKREMKQRFDSALESSFGILGLPFILDYLHIYYARRYVSEALSTSMREIEQHFTNARTYESLIPLITAYTATKQFDNVVNQHCIEVLPGLLQAYGTSGNTLATSIFYLIASFNYDPMLRPNYAYTGCVYRGLKMTLDDLQMYKKGELVVNRPFVSTSKTIRVANIYAGVGECQQFRKMNSPNNSKKYSVRCTYEINRTETRAISIANMSIIPAEEEVLLMPLSTFRIININFDPQQSLFDMKLEDCDLPSESDPTAPIIHWDFCEMANVQLVVPIPPIHKHTSVLKNPNYSKTALDIAHHGNSTLNTLNHSIIQLSTAGVIPPQLQRLLLLQLHQELPLQLQPQQQVLPQVRLRAQVLPQLQPQQQVLPQVRLRAQVLPQFQPQQQVLPQVRPRQQQVLLQLQPRQRVLLQLRYTEIVIWIFPCIHVLFYSILGSFLFLLYDIYYLFDLWSNFFRTMEHSNTFLSIHTYI
ncbi:unnamed protein product [Adineta steineri]|uniref:NAD(P)(+)--arginine ADP-ribosyltransferase n=1 Tax=Adineta steineri TaxID=433720 RepID=A0A813WKK2_9BILA|nr:unnamed protein product [Adineta steineri]